MRAIGILCEGRASTDESSRYSLVLVLPFARAGHLKWFGVLDGTLGAMTQSDSAGHGRRVSRSVIELNQSQDRFWWDSWLFCRDSFALVFFYLRRMISSVFGGAICLLGTRSPLLLGVYHVLGCQWWACVPYSASGSESGLDSSSPCHTPSMMFPRLSRITSFL